MLHFPRQLVAPLLACLDPTSPYFHNCQVYAAGCRLVITDGYRTGYLTMLSGGGEPIEPARVIAIHKFVDDWNENPGDILAGDRAFAICSPGRPHENFRGEPASDPTVMLGYDLEPHLTVFGPDLDATLDEFASDGQPYTQETPWVTIRGQQAGIVLEHGTETRHLPGGCVHPVTVRIENLRWLLTSGAQVHSAARTNSSGSHLLAIRQHHEIDGRHYLEDRFIVTA